MVSRRGLLLLVLLAGGCSPLVRFEGVVEVSGVDDPIAERLHLWIRADVDSHDLEASPTRMTTAPGRLQVTPTIEDDELRYAFGVGGGMAEVDVQFWYDRNGDGARDPGDRAGRLPAPVIGSDRGWSNMNDLGAVVLEDAPSPDGWSAWPPLRPERIDSRQ